MTAVQSFFSFSESRFKRDREETERCAGRDVRVKCAELYTQHKITI